jgi:hypothetical protein
MAKGKSKSDHGWVKWVCGTFIFVSMVGGCSSVLNHSPSTPLPVTPAPTQSQAVTPKAETKVVQGYTTGVYEVGTGAGQVPPGKYKCSETSGYFARLRGTDGSFGNIIANGIVQGPTVLTIQPTDKAVELHGTWLWMG